MWINTPNARLAVEARRGLRIEGRTRRHAAALCTARCGSPSTTTCATSCSTRRELLVDSNEPLLVMPLGECATVDVRSAAPEQGVQRPAGSWLARGAARSTGRGRCAVAPRRQHGGANRVAIAASPA